MAMAHATRVRLLALACLEHATQLDRRDLDAAELNAALQPGGLRNLVIRDNRVLGGLDFLSGQDRITHLDIGGGTPHLKDLSPLVELPLTWLALDSLSGLENPGALHSLAASTTLRALDLGFPLHADSLDEALPRGLPLDYLRFTKGASRFTGLRGLGRMDSVKQLSLAELAERLTPEDFAEISRMPSLTELRVNWGATGWEAAPVLPGITSFRLNNFSGTEDVAKLPDLLPDLRRLTIHLAPEVTAIPEHVLELLPMTPVIEKTDTVL